MPKLIPRSPRQFRWLTGLFAVIGCTLSAHSMAATSAPLDRWEQLRAQDLRLAGVAYKMSVRNTGLCPDSQAPQAGFVMHSIEQYDLADRQGVTRKFGMASYVGVIAVVEGSPAQRSGLAADDQLVSVNGRGLRITEAAASAAPTRATVEFAQSILAREMARGEIILRVSRTGAVHDLRFTADTGCDFGVELMTGSQVNAWTDGQHVVVSSGIVALCASDGELALVIGHELAHTLLHHNEQAAAAGSASRQVRPTGTGLVGMRETEEEADRLGVQLASGASYDLGGALAFVGRLLDANDADPTAGTHPLPARRLALLKAEITATLRRGR